MLVFKRQPGQSLMIGTDIRIVVMSGNRIGIDAPRMTPVHRGEVYEKLAKQGSVPSFADLRDIADATSDPQGG